MDPERGFPTLRQIVLDCTDVRAPAEFYRQMLHLDLTVPTVAALDDQHARSLALGARLLYDRSGDPEEPLRVYADPAGHPFCVFVLAPMG